MKLIALVLLFLLCCYSAMAQNLVLNPSFEDTVGCPDNYSTLSDETIHAKGWSSFYATPDYFNSCNANQIVGVPNNFFGHQNAASGNAYMGLYSYQYQTGVYREIVGCKLLKPLVPGNKYYASIKVNLADSSNLASNNIGLGFSTIFYDFSVNPVPINAQAKAYSFSIITDTASWIKISGSFISDSAYKYIFIGNLFTDDFTDTVTVRDKPFLGGGYGIAYYYLDDVCVTTDSAGCVFSDGTDEINTPASKTPFLIYPNPVTDVINVQLNSVTANSIMLYNSLGKVVYSQNEAVKNKSYQIDASSFAQGLYLLQINCKEKIITEKISIIH